MKLLVSQKDELYMYIEASDLSPAMFEFTERESNYVMGQITTVLNFKNSDFFFAFETAPNTEIGHFASYSPGEDTFIDNKNSGKWGKQMAYFIDWLGFLKREISSPNSWNRLSKEIEEYYINFESDYSKFTFREYEDLRAKISELKVSIKSLEIGVKQVEIINGKLDHLIEMAKDLSKFDWTGLFIGTIMSLVIQLSIPPETGKLLLQIIKQTFNNLFLN